MSKPWLCPHLHFGHIFKAAWCFCPKEDKQTVGNHHLVLLALEVIIHPDSSWPATWVSYYAVLLWLLQVAVLLRVLWGHSAATACVVASQPFVTVASEYPQRYCVIWDVYSRSEESGCVLSVSLKKLLHDDIELYSQLSLWRDLTRWGRFL